MKRNLLFISRYPEIIDEFQGILEEKQIETEIAQNGTDAMELLKQKEYQILVTDLNLDGYNGDKIISYVNQVFPASSTGSLHLPRSPRRKAISQTECARGTSICRSRNRWKDFLRYARFQPRTV